MEKNLIKIYCGRVLFEVANAFQITEGALISKCRKQNLVHARSICYLIFRQLLRMRLKEICAVFTDRNHATIIHGIQEGKRKHKDNIEFQKRYNQVVKAVFADTSKERELAKQKSN